MRERVAKGMKGICIASVNFACGKCVRENIVRTIFRERKVVSRAKMSRTRSLRDNRIHSSSCVYIDVFEENLRNCWEKIREGNIS